MRDPTAPSSPRTRPAGFGDATEPTRIERPINGRLPPRSPDTEPVRGSSAGTWEATRHIDTVRIDGVLGTGGMGTVYRGFDEQLGRPVAVKTMRHRDLVGSPARERLRREARILSRLNHPSICQLYELVETSDADYLVLELVEGTNLREVVVDRRLSAQERFAVAEQIVEALAVAHRHGIVHRDLKPENVMLTAEGGIKILDFGIAHADFEDGLGLEDSTSGETDLDTVAGTVLGTARYMSPEQARGEPVSTASDIYSLSLLLEELWLGPTAKPPDSSAVDTVRVIAERRGSRLRQLPRGLAALVVRCSAAQPADRPTAHEVLVALRHLHSAPRRIAIRAGIAAASTLVALGVVKYTIDLRNSEARARDAQASSEALVGFLLEDLQDQLEPLGRLDLVDRVARRALEHFQSQESLQDGERAALARRQVGKVLAARGDLDGAITLYQEALVIDQRALVDEEHAAEVLGSVATSHLAIGMALEDSGDSSSAAAELTQAQLALERAIAAAPEDPRWRRELAAVASAQGGLARSLGERATSSERHAAAITTLTALHEAHPEDHLTTTALVEALYGAGLTFHFDVGDAAAAEQLYRQAIGLIEQLVAAGVDSAQHRYRLAVLNGQGLCQLAADRDDLEAASVANRRALELLERLVREDPTNGRFGHALCWENLRAAGLALRRNQTDEALVAYRAAVASGARLAEGARKPTEWRSAYGFALRGLAEQLRRAGDLAAAIEQTRVAVAIHDQVARDRGGDIFGLEDTLGARTELVELEIEAGDETGARRTLEQLRETTVAAWPLAQRNALLRETLTHALLVVGQSARQLGLEEVASDSWRQSLELTEQARSQGPLPIAMLEHTCLAALLLGDTARAQELAGELVDQGWDPAAADPQLVAALGKARLVVARVAAPGPR